LIIQASPAKRKFFFMIFDIVIITFATYIAYSLRFDFNVSDIYIATAYIVVLFLIITRVALFYYFSIYDISWRHFGFKDTTILVSVTMASTFMLVILAYFAQGTSYIIPRSIIPIEFFISLFLIMTLRVSKRLYLEYLKKNIKGETTIVIASLDRANIILRTIDMKGSGYYPIAIINESRGKIKVNGVDVYSFEKFKNIYETCDVAIIDEAIKTAAVYKQLNDLSIKNIKVASDYGDYGAKINDISVEDLLARYPKDLDTNKIASFVKDKTILVTGAGGSIGSEICRQCELFGAKKLILLDNSEFNLYSIEQELQKVEKVAVMQNVQDAEQIDATLKKYKPDIVIHAAAYKHVPLVEANIQEGIINNVVGTKNMIDLAIKNDVEKFVMISTDKAVRPTNVMGATKRICELYAQNSNGRGKTDIVAVRFGNVLGSSGSVIPKFKSQIENGNNITVTHPDITRYFMLIPEACELVLQAGAIGTGGEIFILDMGEPIRIVDLAQKMIDLSGREDIEIEFSGLRPGEKLYEELLIDKSDAKTQYESITVAKPTLYDAEKLNADIEELLKTSTPLKKLQEIVPEFTHQLNKKEEKNDINDR